MEQIPLERALMCINCNTITRMPARACPHCTGENLMALGKWLEPMPAPPAAKRCPLVLQPVWLGSNKAVTP